MPLMHIQPNTANGSQPCLRDIDSPPTWTYCFLTYAAIYSSDPQVHDLLTYGRLLMADDHVTPLRKTLATGPVMVLHIGANHKAVPFRASGHNLQAVWENPQLVEQHIREEVQCFCLLGPVPPFLATTCHTSPIGLIPKPGQ